MRYWIVIFFCVVSFSGCVTGGRIDQSYKLKGKTESVIVFGLKQPSKRISIFRGSVEGGFFVQDPLAAANYFGTSNDGYVVFKAKAGLTLGLPLYFHDNSTSLKNRVWPCADDLTVAFEVPAGKVIYLGDFELGAKGERFLLKITDDIDSAQNHLRANLPNIANQLEKGLVQRVKSAEKCQQTIVVPIVVG